MAYSTQQYINPVAYRARNPQDVPLLQAEVVDSAPSWGEQAMAKGRMAVDALLGAVDPFHRTEGKITGLRSGRVAGAGAILSLLAAANELNDPNESAGRNLAQAGGGLVGSLGGQALGGLGGRFLGGAVAGGLGGGPIGALIGATLAGLVGSEAGQSLASAAADVIGGSPEDRALSNAKKQARAAAEAEADRMRMLMPLQDQAAQIALRNETARQKALAEIQGQQLLQQAVAQGLLEQQRGGSQQFTAMANAILGGA
jgi:hypothetical protein